jgi:gamma-glutamyl phosphate reductase
VTIEAASLAIKSGNACILRGGSEAIHSNVALWKLVQAALAEAGCRPSGAARRDHRPRRGRPPHRLARRRWT